MLAWDRAQCDLACPGDGTLLGSTQPRSCALAQTARKLGVRLNAEVKGMEVRLWRAPRDMIVLSYVGSHDRVDVFQRALKPGGFL